MSICRRALMARFTCTVYLAHFIEHLVQLMTEDIVVELIVCQHADKYLLILHWKYIFFPLCFERLMHWWEWTTWSMNCSLCEDECTYDVTSILPLNDSVDYLTLSLALSYTFSEASSTKLPILQQAVTPWKLMDVWWNHGAKMKWKKKKYDNTSEAISASMKDIL